MGEGGRSAAVDAQIEDSDPVGWVRDAMRQRRNGLEFPDPILFLYNFVPTSKEMCRHRQREGIYGLCWVFWLGIRPVECGLGAIDRWNLP